MAQRVLLSEVPGEKYFNNKYGPNYKHYIHGYMHSGFYVEDGNKNNVEINNLKSYRLGLGCRYKLKINKYFSTGLDLSSNINVYNIKQDKMKVYPDRREHEVQKLILYNIGLSPYFRINFGRRGNKVGKYVDLGFDNFYSYIEMNLYKDKPNNNTIVKEKETRLNYINNFNFGPCCRFAMDQFILFFSYRLNDMFRMDKNSLSMTRYEVGMEIGFYN